MTEEQKGFARESLLISDIDQKTGQEFLRQFNEREKVFMFDLVDDFNEGVDLHEKYFYGGHPKDRTGLLEILARSGYLRIEKESCMIESACLPKRIIITSKGFRYVRSTDRPGKLKISIFRRGLD